MPPNRQGASGDGKKAIERSLSPRHTGAGFAIPASLVLAYERSSISIINTWVDIAPRDVVQGTIHRVARHSFGAGFSYRRELHEKLVFFLIRQ